MSELALSGIRVADFSRVLAGPLVGMTLGDLGADVIKVEPPGGDDTRHWAPPTSADGTATYFQAVNRNKRSLLVDLKSETDKAVVENLIRRSDILVENFRPGVMDRLGLGWEAVHELNPDLIYCSISGFGRGKGAKLPGYDAVVQAMGGLMSVTGHPNGDSVKAGVAVVDVLAGQNALTGILAALYAREKGHGGQHVDVSLFSSLLFALSNHSSAYLNAGVVAKPEGNAHASIEPYSTFPTADGALMLCVGNDKQFVALCDSLGIGDVGRDDRFATNTLRVENKHSLRPIISDALAAHGKSHWAKRLTEAGVPCGPINDIADAFRTAQEIGLEPVDVFEGFSSVRSPVGLSATPARTVRRPPRLDEHGEELREWLAERPIDLVTQR